MDPKLFLLEFHIGTITFEPTFKPLPLKEEIVVNIKFADVTLNIDPEVLPLGTSTAADRTITYNMGKSYLFTLAPKELLSSLKQSPLKLSLRVDQKTEGIATIAWMNEFMEMINLFQKIGVVKAVDHTTEVKLKNKSDKVIGKMDIFLRLSCFGDCVETQYEAKRVGTKKEYIFKNPYDKNTFKCEILEGSNDVLPVVNLYNPVTRIEPTVAQDEDHGLSWTEIFGVDTTVNSRASYSPFCGNEMTGIPLTEILRQTSADTVSICFRPDENKFFDLLNLITTEVSTTPEQTMITFTKEKEKTTKSATKQKKVKEEVPAEDPLELTADKINRMLCKNKDCPAAKKFKEYGIGPLATGKGLGTLYGDVEPPVQYGLSHTYGTMNNYGPYGVYSRPKTADQPFVPSKNAQETKLPPKLEEKHSRCSSEELRLRGGGPWPHQPAIMKDYSKIPPKYSGTSSNDVAKEQLLPLLEHASKTMKCSSNDILRLRGGGPYPTKDFPVTNQANKSLTWDELLRLRGGGAVDAEIAVPGLKSPIKECKAVMDKFDEILVAYKKALGPCGQATCPNAPSLAQEKCRSICGKGEAIPPSRDGGILCETPCDFSEGYQAAACRDPTCAYAKYKLDLVDRDAALELQFLPPAVSGKCGHPKCPYPIKPDLPPIHWDCPDPLPKGACKNLNCPLQPPDLRKLMCAVPKPGPCGSPDCPYALPPPCGLPTCPFRPKPTCPFLEKQKKKKRPTSCWQPEEEEGEEDVCENPDCPFANEDVGQIESSEENMKGQFVGCSNPSCPFATKGKRRPKAKSDNIDICGNPSCPFAKAKKQSTCDNPSCPFAKPKDQSACGNPSCPFAKPKKQSTCDNPSCPFAPKPNKQGNDCGSPQCPYANKPNKEGNICSDPQCPFAEKQNANKQKDEDVCDNPDCPFAGNRKKKSKEICANPDCPFNEEKCSKESVNCSTSESVCENPDCPYAGEKEKNPVCDDPACPYLQPLPSCGIPGCPYEPVPVMPCYGPKKQSVVPRLSGTNDKETIVLVETEIIAQVTENVVLENPDCQVKCEVIEEIIETNNNGKKKKKKRSKFVYSMGNQYPGVKVGHKECVTPIFKVPPKMGWLWNVPMEMMKNIKPRRGWKPGAIQRNIAAVIRAHREAKGLGILRLPKFKRNKQGEGIDDAEDDVLVSPKPTLQIQKKDGAYWITMNPLKDPKTLVDNEDPYMDCTPMQFKITKNKKKKDGLGENDSKLCYCEEVDSSSSSDSELDIEFTPPAGIIHPERFKKKKNVVHCEAQYDPKDFCTEKPAKDKGKKPGKKDKEKGKGKGKGGKKGKK